MSKSWRDVLPLFLKKKLEGRQYLESVIINTTWLFADNVLRLGIGLFVGVWMARYLGPSQFGLFNYALSFVFLFSSLATLGLDGIVVRDIVRDPACKEETLGTAFVLKIIGGLVSLAPTVGVIFLLRPDDRLVHWLVGITAAGTIFQAFDTIGFWFQSQVQSKYSVFARNAAFLIVALIKVSMILLRAPLIAFAWAGLAEIVIAAVGLVIAYRSQGHSITKWVATAKRARSLLVDSWPLILSGVAIFIQARIDQVMLGDWVGDSEVGQYSAAMRVIEVFGFIPMIIQSSVAPVITSAKISGEEYYYDRLLNLYRIMFILFLATAIPIFFLAGPIVLFLFGNAYQPASGLLCLFAIRLLFTNFGVAKSLFITNENLFKYSMFTAIVGSLANVSLNYILIPRYASIGAIWAMIISFIITIFIVDVFFSSLRKNLNIMIEAMLTPWKLRIRY